MTCIDTQKRIDELLDDALSPLEHESLKQHINHCVPCRDQLEEALIIKKQLCGIPVPPMSTETRTRLFNNTHDYYHAPHRNSFYKGFASAIAASVVFFAVAINIMPDMNADAKEHNITLSVNEQRSVNLVFHSSETLADATMTIDLPSHVEVAGFAGKKTLSWKTSIKRGQNKLTLPVIMLSEGNGKVTATINHNGDKKTFNIHVASEQPGLVIMGSMPEQA